MTHGETTPCCEEAALTANELARRNEELSEAQDKIAALTKALGEANDARADWMGNWKAVEARAKKAEAERDEARGSRDYWIDLYGELRDELQAKLDDARKQRDHYMTKLAERHAQDNLNDAENHVVVVGGKLPAWARPTLDREKIIKAVIAEGDKGMILNLVNIVDMVLSLVPAAEGWPDEDQRVEEQAKELYDLVGPSGMSWDEMTEDRRCDYRAAIRAGWTPPESEDEK